MMDTIFALASAPGKAGISVVRVSGPKAVAGVEELIGSVPSKGLRQIVNGEGALVDEALVLRFPEGASFTGEEVVELHLHGSSAILRTVLQLLGTLEGFRLAEAGEFTRRAFENGRLDLAQVEGLADLIDAETEAQRLQAMRVFSGALGKKAAAWRTDLLRAAALIEATIDFVDEDVPVDVYPEATCLIRRTIEALNEEAEGARIGERIRSGFEVAILGAPNVGKSTLLNHLAGREAAITSEFAGTTRDVIEVRLDLDGLPVTFLDTAGLREASDQIEKIGIERGLERARVADLRIYMLGDAEEKPQNIVQSDIVVRAKGDLHPAENAVSGRTGLGVDRLVEQVSAELRHRSAGVGIAMRERHRVALLDASAALDRAVETMEKTPELADLVAEDLNSAARDLQVLVGKIDVEDVLGTIFSSFCIGK